MQDLSKNQYLFRTFEMKNKFNELRKKLYLSCDEIFVIKLRT
jgi:hypothetical protein